MPCDIVIVSPTHAVMATVCTSNARHPIATVCISVWLDIYESLNHQALNHASDFGALVALPPLGELETDWSAIIVSPEPTSTTWGGWLTTFSVPSSGRDLFRGLEAAPKEEGHARAADVAFFCYVVNLIGGGRIRV